MRKVTNIILLIFLVSSCTLTHKLNTTPHTLDLSLPITQQQVSNKDTYKTDAVEIINKKDGKKAYIVESEQEDNETMASVKLDAISIVSRTKTTPERMGMINIDFIVNIPSSLNNKNWGVYFTPTVDKGKEIDSLEKIVIKGELFSELQKRQYWQFNKYLNNITNTKEYATNNNQLIAQYYLAKSKLSPRKQQILENIYKNTIKYPYAQDSRLDSVISHKHGLKYYYHQDIKTSNSGGRIDLWFKGEVKAIDNSSVDLPDSDTLSYIITSVISLLDTTKVYKTKIIEKYVSLDTKYRLNFPVGSAEIKEEISDNKEEISNMKGLLETLLHQNEFYLDSISLSASGSPDGSYYLNNALAKKRAVSLSKYLVNQFENNNIDTLLKVKSIAEDWDGLQALIKEDSILTEKKALLNIIKLINDFDKRDYTLKSRYPKQYQYIKEKLYPQLRAVNLKYYLRRTNMVKDTIHTTEIDSTYLVGVALLKEREYVKALSVLEPYKNFNSAIMYMSLGYDKEALEILQNLKIKTANSQYLSAVACVRLNKKKEASEWLKIALELEPRLKFRANLDPEIQDLLNYN